MNIVQVLPPEWAEPGDVLPHILDESCPCSPVLEAVPLSGGGVGHTLTHNPNRPIITHSRQEAANEVDSQPQG